MVFFRQNSNPHLSYINRNPIYHQAVFATLMFTTTFRTIYLLRNGEDSKRLPQAQRTTIARLFSSGAATFAFGFLIWNLDNIFCNTVTQWKQAVGWPTAFLLEGAPLFSPGLSQASNLHAGHSWWHVLTVSLRRSYFFISTEIAHRHVKAVGTYLMLVGNTCE